MKKLILVFLLFVVHNSLLIAQSGWVWQYPQYTGKVFNSVYFFLGTTTGWAAGNDGHLMKTTDDGTTWQIQNNVTTSNIHQISFINSQTGWFSASTDNTYNPDMGFFRTTNGGNNWIRVYNSPLYNFFFIDGNTGWLPGTPATIIKTTNGGYYWSFYNVFFQPMGIYFLNSQTGFSCGNSLLPLPVYGQVFKTTDGGINWIQIGANFQSANLGFIWFENELTGWVVDKTGTDMNACKTTNGGINWIVYPLNITSNVRSVKFFNADTVVIMTEGSCVKTTNGGNNWILIKQKNNYSFTDMCFKNINTGFISTNGAQIIKTNNSGLNWNYLFGEKNVGLNDIKMLDYYTGWVVGDSGTILKTTNGGDNWIYSSLGQYQLQNVFFINNQTGWIVGSVNIFKTTNGGINWTMKYTPSAYIFGVYFTSSENGWLLSDSLYRTTNGGENWSPVISNAYYGGFNTMQFIDSQTGWVGGEEMYKTTNGGANWTKLSDAGFSNKKGFQFFNSQLGWALFFGEGGYYGLYKTTNGGINWNDFPGNIGSYPTYAIDFTDSINGFILTTEYLYQNFIFKTTNSGNNWSKYFLPLGGLFTSLDFVNSQTGWIIGRNNSIIKNVNGGVFVKKIGSNVPTAFRLEQNYPNPFNPVTKIKFQIPSNIKSETSDVKLIIYDITGREIQTLVKEKLNPGSYEVTFDGSNFASGVYFYQLKVGDYIQTRKMVLLK